MPAPSTSLSTLRPDLATFMEFDLEANRRGFIGPQIAPVIDVQLVSDNPGKVPIEQLLKVGSGAPRAAHGSYPSGSATFTTWSYATLDYGWEEPVDDRERAMYAHLIDAEQLAVARAYNNVLLNAEIRVASLLFSATWTGGGASLYTDVGTTEWAQANWATATPIEHVEAAVRKVHSNTGIWPNAIALNMTKFRDLRQCAQIRDRIVASGAGTPAKASDITPAMVASCFDLKYCLVAGSSKDSATEGQSTVIADVWGDYAMICRIAETKDVREPCIARTFHYVGQGSKIDGAVSQYRREEIVSDVYRVRHDTDEVVMYTELGHLIGGI
jgi:hypothetical protein